MPPFINFESSHLCVCFCSATNRCQHFFTFNGPKFFLHPASIQPNQLGQAPTTHPRRHTSRLYSSRLLWSNMLSSPRDRLISRSSKDRSVSGSSSTLSGQSRRFMRTFSLVCVMNVQNKQVQKFHCLL